MEATWLGHSCVRLRGKDATIVIDPYQPGLGYNLGRITADIVCITHDHPGHNNAAAIGGEPKIVDGPGEYEIKHIQIIGVQTYHDPHRGKERGKNTAYVIDIDEVTVCHLGDLGHVPNAEQMEELDRASVLFVPVGGKSTLDAALAVETVSLIDPKIIVPIHYSTASSKLELDPIERFLKAMGVSDLEPQSKLSVTKSTIPETQQIVLLDYRRG